MKSKKTHAIRRFEDRHIGPDLEQQKQMLKELKLDSIDALIDSIVPDQIRSQNRYDAQALSESEAQNELQNIIDKNQIAKSYIGCGYYDTLTPAVIQRNILENPGWYTQYTAYQSEISQGRLEALLNFQTMVADLTGLPLANASLLDEATAAAEAMLMAHNVANAKNQKSFFVSELCFPQTIAVIKTRAKPLNIKVVVGHREQVDLSQNFFGALFQYPAVDGSLLDYTQSVDAIHQGGGLAIFAADLLALTMYREPASFGADICIGNTQRFGVPLGFGGPHAAYLSAKDEYKRRIPGRIVGVSKNREGKTALRLALQTREQHIRRDKATSNICTSQVLLAIMSSMYAVYHGAEGLKSIAQNIHHKAQLFASGAHKLGFEIKNRSFFDTITLKSQSETITKIFEQAEKRLINLRRVDDQHLSVSFDEKKSLADVWELLELFSLGTSIDFQGADVALDTNDDKAFLRQSSFLEHPTFCRYHSETELLRYIKRLESKDLSLTASMIPLGSCTMKLNAVSELQPVSWPKINAIHPFAPASQVEGYVTMIQQLETMLAECTGFDRVSLQPNAGSQGEYAGLLVIKSYLESKGESHRNVCLIPASAHGTNPASAVMAGFEVVVVKCDSEGNISLEDLQLKISKHQDRLAALMITYPSTHGVFEESIVEICQAVHHGGGQVYMDGANMNAQLGLCYPGEFGPDVCHLNLHKTFCIPHGGGGPGMGPICVRNHLADFLPSHPIVAMGGQQAIGPVSAAPWGSPSILPITWMYIRMMGGEGLRKASEVAMLNANYLTKKLSDHYSVLYKGKNGFVAHECILDFRPFKSRAGVEVEDIAKRLMDFGFHSPTMSFPVPGTLMIEPTESENLAELDRFCQAMVAIRSEIKAIEDGQADRKNNVLKNAPHTTEMISTDSWDYPYSRSQAVYPVESLRAYKFWPASSRIDNAYGDRNLMCSCPPVDSY